MDRQQRALVLVLNAIKKINDSKLVGMEGAVVEVSCNHRL